MKVDDLEVGDRVEVVTRRIFTVENKFRWGATGHADNGRWVEVLPDDDGIVSLTRIEEANV